jgi:hypothetical protein
MSNEFKHASVGAELSQAEFESAGLHVLDGQTKGDMIIASSATQLSRYPYMGKNAIINGCAHVDQRATNYTLIKDAYGIRADRFYGMATGTAVSAGVLTKTTTANCGTTGLAFKFSGVTLTGTGIVYFRYRMEAKDAIKFKNRIASFSCKVYHDVGSAVNYTIYIRKPNTADNFSAVTAVSDSGAISVPTATETTLNYLNISMGDCSNGIELEIKIECGAITTKNFEFTECQLELGSFATNFEFRPYQQELALCNRYCWNIGYGSTYVYKLFCVAIPYDTTHFYSVIQFPVQMCKTPTLLIGAYSNFALGYPGSYACTGNIVAHASTDLDTGVLTGAMDTVPALTNYHLYRNNNTETIIFIAEL